MKVKREPYHPLAYAFIYFAFMTGGLFVLMSLRNDHSGITMYQVTYEAIGDIGTFLWGVLSMLSAVGVLVYYYTQKLWIALTSSLLGVSLWLFLMCLYALYGYVDGIFAAVIPNVWFWSWFVIKTNWKVKMRKSRGDFNDPTWTTKKLF